MIYKVFVDGLLYQDYEASSLRVALDEFRESIAMGEQSVSTAKKYSPDECRIIDSMLRNDKYDTEYGVVSCKVFVPMHMPETDAGVGKKYDSGKSALDLLPWDALTECGKVLSFGASKYGPENWRNVTPSSRYEAAMLRHLAAWKQGEALDSESGLPHLAHMLTSAMFLVALELKKIESEAK